MCVWALVTAIVYAQMRKKLPLSGVVRLFLVAYCLCATINLYDLAAAPSAAQYAVGITRVWSYLRYVVSVLLALFALQVTWRHGRSEWRERAEDVITLRRTTARAPTFAPAPASAAASEHSKQHLPAEGASGGTSTRLMPGMHLGEKKV